MIKTIVAYIYRRILIGPKAEEKDSDTHRSISETAELQEVYEYLSDSEKRRESIEKQENAYNTVEAYHAFMQQISVPLDRVRSRYVTRWVVAASLILVASVAYYLWTPGTDSSGSAREETAAILPGTNKATLTLADGRTIDLSNVQEGIIVGDNEITYSDGTGVMSSEVSTVVSPEDNPHLMSLSTPKGGTYQVMLPDGTKVWLNAGSTLKYPSRFSGDERIVELEGEAFFSVDSRRSTIVSKKPFIVKTRGQEVMVLGTEFNITAYPDEKEMKTTLVAGSIRVSAHVSGRDQSLVLKPGEETVRLDAGLQKQAADIAAAAAWKDGVFYFNDTPFDEMVKQLSRWYDIDIIYASKTVPLITFTGKMSRKVSLDVVLDFLRTSQVHFRMSERKLIIL